MKNRSTVIVRSPVLIFLMLMGLTNALGQVFVDSRATGANDGSSWLDAYIDLQTALSNTTNGEIWVAQGIYKPTNCNPCSQNDLQTSFFLPPDVQLFGGFLGTETLRSARDWEANPTILSGDIGVQNDSTDNVYKVVVAENSTTNTILDGFIIEEGNADGSFGFSSGGGLYMDANPFGTANMQVRNCTFRNNYGGGGGGLAIDCVLGGSSEAIIANCIFEGNTASLRVSSTGAAVFIQGNSGAIIKTRFVNCLFKNNFCGNDGGAFSSTPTGEGTLLAIEIDSCLFENNRAEDRGGAIWYRMSSQGESRVNIKNSQFISNSAGGQAGAIFARSSFGNIANDTILNCFFFQNISDGGSPFNDGEGGALFFRGSQNGTRNQNIINCVFDRNFASTRGGAIGSTSFFSSAGTCNAQIVNCTFYRNRTNGTGGALHVEGLQGQNNSELHNNIFWNDSTGIASNEIFNNGGIITASFNNFDGGIPQGVMDGGSNLSINPGFADPLLFDLHLPRSSPLINAGNNSAILPYTNVDIDGDTRIFESVVDLGAYETGLIFVDQMATNGLQNGSSWTNAFLRVEEALDVVAAGDQIWVAKGIYKPISCAPCTEEDKEQSYNLVRDTELYGGFTGNETILSQRDWVANPTILSGDIGVQNDSLDNVFKVIIAENSTFNTILDGFIIEEGNADGSFGFSSGGGLYMDANPGGTANMQIRNCTFRNNYGGGGGGLAIDCVLGGSSEALISNCHFVGNTASLRVSSTGAAVFIQGNSGAVIKPRFENCTFRDNYCGNDGGAFSATPSGEETLLAFEIDSCLFENNQSEDRGGAIWYRMSSGGQSRVVIKNSQFISNIAGGQAGAIFARSSFANVANDTIINCLFSQNRSQGTSPNNEGEGGALFLRGSQQGVREHHIINSLFDRNFAAQRGGAIATTSFIFEAGVCDAKIINSSFYGNATNGNGGAIHTEGSQGSNNMIIANSILWGDQAFANESEIFNNGATITASFNIIQDGLPANIIDTVGNIFEDPQYIDPQNGDLRISSCSPAIDAGSNQLIPQDAVDIDLDRNLNEKISIDFIGQNRFFNDSIDIGAYEWDATTPILNIQVNGADVNCNGECDGTAQIIPQGGVPNYNYSWSNGQNTAIATNLCAGTYYLTVSDDLSCVLTDSIVISENLPLEIQLNSDTSICLGQEVILEASALGGDGDYSFEWDQGQGNESLIQVAPQESTTYTIRVRDGNQCEQAKAVNISILTAPIPQISGVPFLCSGGSTILEASPGYLSYLWSDGTNNSSISIDSEGTFSLTVSDQNGCQANNQIEVIQLKTLLPSIIGERSFCEGQSIVLSTDNYESYLWSTGEISQSIEIDQEGEYNLEVTDTLGCKGNFTIRVSENKNPEINISGPTGFCLGGGTVLDAGPGFSSYQWSNGSSNQIISTAELGDIHLSAIDSNGCIGRDTVTLSLGGAPPKVSLDSTMKITCKDECVTLNAKVEESTEFSVVWGSQSGLFASPVNESTVEVCRQDVYFVTVIDDITACRVKDTLEVGQDKTVSIIEFDENVPILDCETEQFTLSATLSGNSNISNVEWFDENGEIMLPNLDSLQINIMEAGDYSLRVTTTNGCVANESIEIQADQNLPIVNAGPDLVLECGQKGVLDASSSSQGENFEISWQILEGNPLENQESLKPGISGPGLYRLSILNSLNKCFDSDTVLVNLQLPELADAGTDFSTCLDTIQLSANLPAGTMGRWSSSSPVMIEDIESNSTKVSSLGLGSQTFIWTLSAPGCPDYSSDQIVISQSEAPRAKDDFIDLKAGGDREIDILLLENDLFNSAEELEINILEGPTIGKIENLQNEVLSYSVSRAAFGSTSIRYQVCNLECPDQCSEAVIFIEIERELPNSEEVPNTITPNGDNMNEAFVFEILEVNPPEAFPDNEIIIFNRWGDVVFQQKDYDNNWNGVNQNREPLPVGTYYYILRLDLENGLILKGDVTIIR